MKSFHKKYLFLLFFLVKVVVVSADTTCPGYDPTYLDHYCDCKNYFDEFYELPFELQVTDSVWIKSSSNVFTGGFTAYLYSDCDVQFDIYQSCTAKNPLYCVTIPKNQARDVTAESIKQKLESMGMGGASMAIYLCIYPINGNGGRLMCYPYNTGYNSTCSDILELLPGMTFVSSHAEDVYKIAPERIADSYEMYLQWSEEGGAGCDLEITRGNCDGEVVVEYEFDAENGVYVLDSELLMDVRSAGDDLFAHFSHDVAAVGRINFNEAVFVDVLTDTVICKGKEFRYGEYVTTEAAIYRYDTVKVSAVEYEVLGYNVIFAEPEVQYDTIALRNNQLPYDYRGEVIDGFGEYDIYLKNSGVCDERIILNVRHNLTTINSVIDTTICGGRFDYGGKSYLNNDVTITDSIWNGSRDTVNVKVINVYFNSQNFVYDTLALRKEEAESYRYKGVFTVKGFGDYEINTHDEHKCAILVYLHVRHRVTNIEETVDTILCDGEVYRHTDGLVYRASVELVDQGWVDDDTYKVKRTNVRFITNELMHDTLYLRYADLPYIYKNKVLLREMEDTIVSILFGKCTGQVLLHLMHKFETTTAEEDVTLCKGRVYEHNGVEYREAATIVDSMWVDRDTYLIKSTRVNFTAPELAHDTIELRASELPYLYREQYVVEEDGFGDHEMTIYNDGECDERIALHVMHRTDVVTATKDTTICEGLGYEHGGEWYYEPVALEDSVWMNSDTMVVTTTYVHFAAPEAQYDTMMLRVSELPYIYRGQYSVTEFGDHEVIISNEGECNELYRLHIYHKIDTVVMVRDSIMCYGGIYVYYDEDGYKINQKEDISFGWQSVLNADTVMIDSLYVRFATEPDIVYDTVVVPASVLISGYKYEAYGKTLKSFGDYSYIGAVNLVTKCKENVYLHLVELAEESVDVTVCEGKGYEHNGVVYYEPVVLVDSVWVNSLKYQITTTYVNFVAPEVQYDTLAIRVSELPYIYRGEEIVDYGEYDLMIRKAGECDERVKLSVQHLVTTITAEQDTTLCEGKGYVHNSAIYSAPTTIVDSAWVNRDTFLIITTRVYFAAPEVEYDTLVVRAVELPYVYRGEQIVDFGEYDLTIRKAGECDERVKLSVQHFVTTITAEQDTTLCEGKGYEHNGAVYTESATIVDSVWVNRDTFLITTTRVYFAVPEIEYDTLALRVSELPYMYRGENVVEFGEYDLTIHNVGECDERVKLYVSHLITTITEEKDTTLCQGIGYEYDGEWYYNQIDLETSEWINQDTLVITTMHVYFTEPEVEYDTVLVGGADLQTGYYYELADVYIYAVGVYDYEIIAEGECTRKISLTVEKDIPSEIDNVVVEEKPMLIMIDGVIYIFYNGEYYTLLGVKVMRN